MQAVNPGDEAAEAFEVVHDQRHSGQHRRKSASRLDGAPHLQLATEHVVGQDDAGSTSVSWLNPRWYRLSERCFLDQLGKVAEHGLKPLVELGAFLGLAR